MFNKILTNKYDILIYEYLPYQVVV